jgi:hypothetical protein
VRDFADGMTAGDMDSKLGRRGHRVSGLEDGESVRGTNSRGAKDIAALGKATFDSIASDGRHHRCNIEFARFTPYESRPVTSAIRKKLGLLKGTGTVVTVEIGLTHRIPNHENLLQGVSSLVSLREILRDKRRKIVLRDVGSGREAIAAAKDQDGRERAKKRLDIPGYPDATAKLTILRAPKQFQREKARFREGGILVKSKHGVHEATLFDPRLESDPHAAWFWGKLSCPYLDDLWNSYDDRREQHTAPDPKNSVPVIDPQRKTGLTKDHPFVVALFAEALKVLRPLVEEERSRAEGQRAEVENRQTRNRLNKLQEAAAKFMEERQDDEDVSRDPNTTDGTSKLHERGYTLNPPFSQLVVGEKKKFWLNIRQEAFPELSSGSNVQIKCLTDDISSEKSICGLDPHPTQPDILRAVWNIKGEKKSSATGMRVRVGPIIEEVIIEVFESEKEKYEHIQQLMFAKKVYRVPADGKRKTVVLMAPISLVSSAVSFEVDCSNPEFKIGGNLVLQPMPKLGIARCTFNVRTTKADVSGDLKVRIGSDEASVQLLSRQPKGSGISISLQDIDLANQRYRWRLNVLEIAARHPSLKRYLGRESENFPGQEQRHFRVLLAEIVSDAVCSKIIERREEVGLYDEEDLDWNFFYAEYSKLQTEFLPMAHKLVVPEKDS